MAEEVGVEEDLILVEDAEEEEGAEEMAVVVEEGEEAVVEETLQLITKITRNKILLLLNFLGIV